jgi:hypothetical protein
MFCHSDLDIDGGATTCAACCAYIDRKGTWREGWDTPGDRAMVEIRNLVAGILVLDLALMVLGLFVLVVARSS